MKIKTTLYAGFPGIGKTHVFNQFDKIALDSDSSKFDKAYFPLNYIEHIKNNMGHVERIFISSHDVVRDALVKEGLDFTLVFPDRSLKEEYIERYKSRGNADAFVKLLEQNWDIWITQLENQKRCDKIVLKSGQYLSDVL